jgi:organic hydroperoxide reductase OsmC/OhrA
MAKTHKYALEITWTGNQGTGTSDYTAYNRNHTIVAVTNHLGDNPTKKEAIYASADSVFRGDATKYNPEDFFLASLASCHMLWFLHICADANVIVLDYKDNPYGILVQDETGSGKFTEVVLQASVQVSEAWMLDKLEELHLKAHQYCFISNSVNCDVKIVSTGRL